VGVLEKLDTVKKEAAALAPKVTDQLLSSFFVFAPFLLEPHTATTAIAPKQKLFSLLAARDEKRRQEAIEAAQQQPAQPQVRACVCSVLTFAVITLVPQAKKNKAHLRPSEKIADAKSKKDHGNTLYKENNTEDASRRYTQALGICAEMDGTLNPTDQVLSLSLSLSLSLPFPFFALSRFKRVCCGSNQPRVTHTSFFPG
jgi:hypothetical protein